MADLLLDVSLHVRAVRRFLRLGFFDFQSLLPFLSKHGHSRTNLVCLTIRVTRKVRVDILFRVGQHVRAWTHTFLRLCFVVGC